MKLMSNDALWITSGASPMNCQKLLDHFGEQRLAGQELGRQPVHGKGFRRHVALGIDVAVKGLPGRHPVEDFDAADLDQPIAAQRVEAGGFGIENDFAHRSAVGWRIRVAAAAC